MTFALNYAQQQRQPSRHLTGIGIVIVMHLLLGYALTAGLARKVVEVMKAPLETKIVEEVKPPPPPETPPPPPPKMALPPPSFVPPPEINVAPQQTAPTITTTSVAPPAAPVTIAPPGPATTEAPRVAAKPAIGNVQACAPRPEDYPAAALRAEATGTTSVRFTIDASGKLANAEIVRSAGGSREHKLLDRVAVQKLSNCKFTPGVDDQGHPVGGSFDVNYVWNLN